MTICIAHVAIAVSVERLGWTLVHSMWQLTLIAFVAAVVHYGLKRRSANTRYIAAVTAFSMMAIIPVVAWTLNVGWDQRSAGPPMVTSRDTVQGEPAKFVVAPAQSSFESSPSAADVLLVDIEPSSRSDEFAGTAAGSPSHGDSSVVVRLESPQEAVAPARSMLATIAAVIQVRLPLIVGIWIIGIIVCSVRPIWSLWIQWRLRRRGLSPAPAPESLQAAMTQLADRMRLTRVVRIAESTLVKVPMVVGYLRPIILLPASVITGLTPTQLEAVLAHELAHIRRHDWLINALQVMLETLLFYHPAVWWLSNRIRQERELCCDDIALSLNVDKAVYARTLLTLEELRQKSFTPALAATGGDLASRVRRLLPSSHVEPHFGTGTIMGLLSVIVSLSLLATSLAASSETQEPDPDTVVAATATDEPQPANAPDVAASDDEPQPEKPIEEARRRSVQVLDESEQPVAGAEVRFQFQHQGPNSFSIDGLMTETTDDKGITAVEPPAESDQLLLTIKADGFGEFSEQQQATGNSVVRIKRGRVIHVRAVDEAGTVLKKAVPLLTQHRIWGREFVPQEDGTFKSPAVDMNRHLMRVVTSQDNGLMLFSDLVDVSTSKPGEDGVLELVLKPGTKLIGRLDDSVPRPVTEGYVQLMVVEGANHELRVPVRDENSEVRGRDLPRPWTWQDSTPVRPDGTFTFESVPAGGIAQIHVVVDGYMSVNPPLEDLAAFLQSHGTADEKTREALNDLVWSRAMWPHLVALDQPSVESAIKCQPTASCDFRILDSAGNPVPDAVVSFNPNGIFINGALFIPGSNNFQNASLVDKLFRGATPFAALNGLADGSPRGKAMRMENEWGQRSFLRAKADAAGRVQIRNLPGGTRENFRVTAKDFVLPKSHLYSRSFDDDRREAYVELIAGETIESTIYLDRDQPVIDREVLVMDDKGRPLKDVTISLSEMRVGTKDWQLWSVQRFGTVQSAKSDQNGRVVLSVPSHIGNIPVERLRLTVNFRDDDSNRKDYFWISGGLVDVPREADGRFVAVIRNPDWHHSSKAVYGTLEDILAKQTPEELMEVMIKNPSLAILRQLLTSAKTKQPEPIELLEGGRSGGEEKQARVHLIPCGDKTLSLVSAKVRPIDGTRREESDFRSLPECVFVFDASGQHVASLGGEIGTTGAGSAENTDILCLGPEEDWFVRVTRFQENGPFEYQSTYYRIGNPVVNSLRYFHYANSNAWSNGPEKITRYGSLYFEFPGSKSDSAGVTLGTTNNGVSVNGIITWDADQNDFVGVADQSVEDRPLYKVDTEWSKEFEALTPKGDQIILAGGAREHDHWYLWFTVVPEGFEAVVSVSIPQADGEAKRIEQKYASGRHKIQFQAKPNDDGQGGSLQLGYAKDEIHKATMPLPFGDPPAAHPPIVNVLNPGESVQLVNRSLKGSVDSLTLDVKLQEVEK